MNFYIKVHKLKIFGFPMESNVVYFFYKKESIVC